MTLYVFGTMLPDADNATDIVKTHIQSSFPEINFIYADPTEEWWQGEKDIILLDTVEGISSVRLFTSFDAFIASSSHVSVHDYDVYMDIKLMLKAGSLHSVQVIGLPMKKTVDIPEIKKHINALVKQQNSQKIIE